MTLLLAFLLLVGNLTSAITPASSGYAYDDNGALTADPTRTYAYDGFGCLASTTLGATTTAYTLDGAGRRLAETTGLGTTSFDLDLRAPLATILADGTRRYLPGDPSAGFEQAGTWYSALTDHLGSPHSYVSDVGVQGTITRWDPFGAARPGSTAAGGIGYAGEWRDPAALIDLRARAYDPALGRFTSRDALGGLAKVPQTANRYSYALNGPYRYTDPSGRFVNMAVANAPLFLSLAIQSIPIVGDAYSAFTGFVGYDPIAGISLSAEERALAIGSAAVIGGGFHLLGRLGDGVADASRLGRAAPPPGAGARGADGFGGGGVLFGQRRAGPVFSSHSDVPAALRGRTVADVSDDLAAGRMFPDDVPIQAFRHSGVLVSANTRSLAALSRAGLRPTRITIIPRSPDLLERLTEIPLVRGQVLPGTRVVITPSRSDLRILEVIDIP